MTGSLLRLGSGPYYNLQARSRPSVSRRVSERDGTKLFKPPDLYLSPIPKRWLHSLLSIYIVCVDCFHGQGITCLMYWLFHMNFIIIFCFKKFKPSLLCHLLQNFFTQQRKCISVFHAHKSQEGGHAVDWSFYSSVCCLLRNGRSILSKCDKLQVVNKLIFRWNTGDCNCHTVYLIIKIQHAMPV